MLGIRNAVVLYISHDSAWISVPHISGRLFGRI